MRLQRESTDDLMYDPITHADSVSLRKSADRVLFRNEFAIAYEAPIDADRERAYLTGWVTYDHTNDENPMYERIQGSSGGDRMIREWFGEMAEHGVSRIHSFVNLD